MKPTAPHSNNAFISLKLITLKVVAPSTFRRLKFMYICKLSSSITGCKYADFAHSECRLKRTVTYKS